jgi:two-component system, NarL family, response regulator LiaR
MIDEQRRATIRLLLVDDHDLFRTGLAGYLRDQSDLEVIAQASGGRMGVRLALELVPDVVLIDLRLPDMSGTDAIRAILATRPEMRVVTLTAAPDDHEITSAINAGACSFLVKDGPIEDVSAAVRAVAGGSSWLSPRAAETVLGRLREAPTGADSPDGPSQQLSNRERDVLRLVARGLENAQIAEALDISPSTAKNHVSSILIKLGLPNRVQAAVYAIRSELD